MRLRFAAALVLVASAAFAGSTTYIYARGNQVHSTNLRLSMLKKLERELGKEFLWARVGGREYMIRDAATLAEVRKVFAPVEAAGAEYEALTRRMRPLEQREEALEDAMEETEVREAAQVREYRDVQRRLRALEAEEKRLDDRQDALEKQAERQMDRLIERAISRGIAERM